MFVRMSAHNHTPEKTAHDSKIFIKELYFFNTRQISFQSNLPLDDKLGGIEIRWTPFLICVFVITEMNMKY